MVKWAAPAKADLKKIFAYIAEDSKYYARRVVQNIVEKTEALNDFPEIGRMVPEVNEKNIRELMIYSYRMANYCLIHLLSQCRIPSNNEKTTYSGPT